MKLDYIFFLQTKINVIYLVLNKKKCTSRQEEKINEPTQLYDFIAPNTVCVYKDLHKIEAALKRRTENFFFFFLSLILFRHHQDPCSTII